MSHPEKKKRVIQNKPTVPTSVVRGAPETHLISKSGASATLAAPGAWSRRGWIATGQFIIDQGCRFGPESKPNPGKQYLDP